SGARLSVSRVWRDGVVHRHSSKNSGSVAARLRPRAARGESRQAPCDRGHRQADQNGPEVRRADVRRPDRIPLRRRPPAERTGPRTVLRDGYQGRPFHVALAAREILDAGLRRFLRPLEAGGMTAHLQIKDLTIAYEKPRNGGAFVAVSDFSLEVPRGRFVTI